MVDTFGIGKGFVELCHAVVGGVCHVVARRVCLLGWPGGIEPARAVPALWDQRADGLQVAGPGCPGKAARVWPIARAERMARPGARPAPSRPLSWRSAVRIRHGVDARSPSA